MRDYPSARDCQHGQLRRSCPICAAESDYASLQARHNALVEAVKKEHLAFDALDDAGFQLGEVGMPIWTDHAAARAEVDWLIENESPADCKGGGARSRL
jgi:hypothetical protein